MVVSKMKRRGRRCVNEFRRYGRYSLGPIRRSRNKNETREACLPERIVYSVRNTGCVSAIVCYVYCGVF